MAELSDGFNKLSGPLAGASNRLRSASVKSCPGMSSQTNLLFFFLSRNDDILEQVNLKVCAVPSPFTIIKDQLDVEGPIDIRSSELFRGPPLIDLLIVVDEMHAVLANEIITHAEQGATTSPTMPPKMFTNAWTRPPMANPSGPTG